MRAVIPHVAKVAGANPVVAPAVAAAVVGAAPVGADRLRLWARSDPAAAILRVKVSVIHVLALRTLPVHAADPYVQLAICALGLKAPGPGDR